MSVVGLLYTKKNIKLNKTCELVLVSEFTVLAANFIFFIYNTKMNVQNGQLLVYWSKI